MYRTINKVHKKFFNKNLNG